MCRRLKQEEMIEEKGRISLTHDHRERRGSEIKPIKGDNEETPAEKSRRRRRKKRTMEFSTPFQAFPLWRQAGSLGRTCKSIRF